MALKLAVIGAASSYTPELLFTLAQDHNKLEVVQVNLVDQNLAKLQLVGLVCQRLIDENRMDIRLELTTSVEQGVAGVDFVLPQIRVGGLEARVRDETLPMEMGMVGNETTGAGGFVCALRTLPPMLEIARTVERVSPGAWILNLSNPKTLKICALLDKKARREVEIEGDYVGFVMTDGFVVGYGIDYAEQYRNLPEIYVIEEKEEE